MMNDTAETGRDSAASLQCFVKNTTLTHVAWFRGSNQLHQSISYSFSVVVLQNLSTVRFLLTVHNVSESDFGEYSCRVGSPYNSSEDEASVWIQRFLPPPPTLHTTRPPDGSSILVLFQYCVMFDMNCFLSTQRYIMVECSVDFAFLWLCL